jgi:hypothetical protein
VLKESQRASNVGVFRESQGQGGKKEHCTAQKLVRLLPLVSPVALALALTVRMPQHLRGVDRQLGRKVSSSDGAGELCALFSRLPYWSANSGLPTSLHFVQIAYSNFSNPKNIAS